MNHPATTRATLPLLSPAVGQALRPLRALAARLDTWLAARKRAADDRAVLAAMSDRDLRDIGIERASVSAVADGVWLRDRP